MSKKVILITGGSAGIGLAASEILLKKDCIVYSGSRSSKTNECSENSNYHSLRMDVNDETSIQAAVNQILSEQGKIDVLICNAGFGIAGAVEDCSPDEVKSQFDTNYFGVVKTIQACLPQFRKQEYGKIITVSSVAGLIPIPYQLHYSSVKAAVLMMMKGLSMEVKDFGIQCCSILPGDTKTNFTSARVFGKKADASSIYYNKMKMAVSRMEKDEQNGRPASFVANSIVKQVFKSKMNTQVIPGIEYKILSFLGTSLPIRLVQYIVGKMY